MACEMHAAALGVHTGERSQMKSSGTALIEEMHELLTRKSQKEEVTTKQLSDLRDRIVHAFSGYDAVCVEMARTLSRIPDPRTILNSISVSATSPEGAALITQVGPAVESYEYPHPYPYLIANFESAYD